MVLDHVNDPVVALSNSVQIFFVYKLFETMRTWIDCQCAETFDDSFSNRFSESLELSLSGWSQKNRIGHRGILETEFLQDGIQWFGTFFLRLGQRRSRICKVDTVFQVFQ